MIVIGAGSNGMALNTDVPVVVLTTPQQVNTQPAVNPTTLPSTTTAVQPANKPDSQLVAAAITKIRQQLKPNKQGGYAASAVGQVLSQLGHDKAMRTKIVKQIPNLKEVGTGPEKRLVF